MSEIGYHFQGGILPASQLNWQTNASLELLFLSLIEYLAVLNVEVRGVWVSEGQFNRLIVRQSFGPSMNLKSSFILFAQRGIL